MVSLQQIQDVGWRIGEVFQPQQVVLFGSYAQGTATEDSDVDLLVILPFEGRPFEKSLEILNRVDVRFPCDLITQRPEDVRRRYQKCAPLIREAMNRGEVFYERHD